MAVRGRVRPSHAMPHLAPPVNTRPRRATPSEDGTGRAKKQLLRCRIATFAVQVGLKSSELSLRAAFCRCNAGCSTSGAPPHGVPASERHCGNH
eukprot:14639218-Alexandrium_andersonii.AAC.1